MLECWDRKNKDYVAIKIVRNVQKYRDAAMIEVRRACFPSLFMGPCVLTWLGGVKGKVLGVKLCAWSVAAGGAQHVGAERPGGTLSLRQPA